MLRQLLDVVARGEGVAPRAIARRLGVTEPMVQLMLDDLVRRGLLAPANGTCASSCDGCPIGPVCSPGAQIWLVTARGRRLIGPAGEPAGA